MNKFIKKMTAFVCIGMFTTFSVPAFAVEGQTQSESVLELAKTADGQAVSEGLAAKDQAEAGLVSEQVKMADGQGQNQSESASELLSALDGQTATKAQAIAKAQAVAEAQARLEEQAAAQSQAEAALLFDSSRVSEIDGQATSEYTADEQATSADNVEAEEQTQSGVVPGLVKLAEYSEVNNTTGKNNDYPMVFVHGVMGYGENECQGKYYWGGDMSIREMLNSEGYEVYTPTLDAMGSNWDRACELYAYLKGGTVDYGKAHSEREGHNRYGKTFKGVLPELGTIDDEGKLEKVHLVGHSMGGETIRALACLLEEGDAAEVAATGNETSPLFTGNKHWVDSITTISTPHDGSQLAEALNIAEPVSHDTFAMLAAIVGTSVLDSSKQMYSLGLEQWGLKQVSGESNRDYFKRIISSNIFKKTHDTGLWDLTHEGAKEFNEKFKAEDDIYYFSVSCCATHTLKNSRLGIQVPNANINPMFMLTANYMGHHIDYFTGVVINREWWKNDGAVSVRSAIGPHEGSKDKILNYDGTAKKGVWNYLGEIDGVDHLEVTRQDMGICTDYLHDQYRSWAKMLSQL